MDLCWGAAGPQHGLDGLIRDPQQVALPEEVGGFRAGCWVDRRWRSDRILPFATRNETPMVRGEHKLRAPLRPVAAAVMLLTTSLPKILSTIGGAE
jgi:hypothetical protein